MDENEEKLYEIIGYEIASKNLKPGIYTKAFSEARGDESQTKLLYIKYRYKQLKKQYQSELIKVSEKEKEEFDLADKQRKISIAFPKKKIKLVSSRHYDCGSCVYYESKPSLGIKICTKHDIQMKNNNNCCDCYKGR